MAFDPNNAAHLTGLTNELNNDPQTYGYAAHIAGGNDTALAALLNKVRDGTDGEAAISIEKGYVTTEELANSIVQGEYAGLTAANRAYLDMLMTLSRVDLSTGSNPRAGLAALFSAGSTTRANVLAAAQRNGSRAEQLWGVESRVSEADVARALGRG